MDRNVEISEVALNDLCALAELAVRFREEEQGHMDSLCHSLRGAVREVRARARIIREHDLV